MSIVTAGDAERDRDEPTDWDDPESVKAAVTRARQRASRQLAGWQEEYGENTRFVAGHQWTDEDKQAFEDTFKAPAAFNRIGPIISAICGQQVNNRQEPRFLPSDVSAAPRAEAWNMVIRWAREQAGCEDEESSVFRDVLVGGVGWTCTSMDYDQNPAGVIVDERIDPRRMRWDATAEKKNLTDSRWVQCDYWYSIDEIRAKFDFDGEIDITPSAIGETRHDAVHDADNDWRYEKDSAELDLYQGMYRVVHHVEWALATVYEYADLDGQVREASPEEWATLTERATASGMGEPPVNRRTKRVYHHAWVVGATVLTSGPAPLQRDFEYQAITGLYDDEERTWYGLVRAMKDPQRYANRLFIGIMYSLAHNAKGGVVVEDDAVGNKRKFEEQWANPAGVAWVRSGGAAKITPKPTGQIPAEMGQMLTVAVDAIRDVGGVNIELLGQQPEHVQPGMIEAMRTKAGLVMLSPWFDALRLYIKRKARMMTEMVNAFVADGRMIRVLGPMGPQFLPLVRDQSALEYDVVVEEATTARDVRERTFAAISQLLPMSVQLGIEPPLEVIDYMPLPEALRSKWKEAALQAKQKPKQPPLEIQLQQLKSQNAMELEKMKADNNRQQVALQAQMQQASEVAQAQSERSILQMQHALEQQRLKAEILQAQAQSFIEARLKAFEILLKGAIDYKTASEKASIQAQAQAEKSFHDAQSRARDDHYAERQFARDGVMAERQAAIAERTAKAKARGNGKGAR